MNQIIGEDKKTELINNITSLLSDNSDVEDDFLSQLDDLYKAKFNKILSIELLQLALPDFSNKLISIVSLSNNNNERENLFNQISSSGVVPDNFRYSPNPMTFDETNRTFLAYSSNINRQRQLICMLPECYMENMQELTDMLDVYYSHPISEQFVVNDVHVGLGYVGKYENVYHRLYIKEIRPLTYMIVYIDLGLEEEIQKSEIKLKYLLNYFSQYECLVIACRLHGIEYKLENHEMPLKTYDQLKYLCRGGPFQIQPCGQFNGILNVKIYDHDNQCLNDLLVQRGFAFSSSLEVKTNQVNHALDDYEIDDYETSTTKVSTAFNDYESDPFLTTSNTQTSKRQYLRFSENSYKIIRNLLEKNATPKQTPKSNNQSNRQLKTNGNMTGLKITVASGGQRLFTTAFSGILRNNSNDQHRRPKPSRVQLTPEKRDMFVDWMCSSTEQESLWLNETHGKALLTYLGRIYNQNAHMYRLFTQMKQDMDQSDDLDILHRLIEKTKQRHDAQTSIGKWEDNSRITRRINDLRFIFEFNNSSSQNQTFNVYPSDLTKIINPRMIKSYFDLGCGDGVITAAIGDYLGLNRENILGGDTFIGQSDKITFVKIDENQSKNCVDLITSFVTFHHISQIDKTLAELVRILRPGGYLILREHDCKTELSFSTKYLHFVHAIMMIARVGEFANVSIDQGKENLNWSEQKKKILEYTKTIHYRSCEEWTNELKNFGFQLISTVFYKSNNPQRLFYAVYQKE
ncbi:hypothetical protein I4U23_005837 [Adineta vaga]|nr:hypothetical protein I4U23_005837 [Adineta vaga]